jgi:hypothetical protein
LVPAAWRGQGGDAVEDQVEVSVDRGAPAGLDHVVPVVSRTMAGPLTSPPIG